MKTIKIIAIIFAFGLIFSCESQLDVVPEDNVASNTVFNSLATIEGAVVGIYSRFQDPDLNGVPQMTSDFMSDNINFVGSFPTLQEIDIFQTLATNGSIDNIWNDGFRTIGAANNVIVNLPNVDIASVTGLTPEMVTQFVAEAQFVRAITNLSLVDQFAQPFQFSGGTNLGIPLVTQPFEGGDISEFQLARSTVNEVHAAIIQDLTDAMAVLPSSNGFRADSGAARALLARLYVYREDWTNAANMANDVINSGEYMLSANFDFYDNNSASSEHIFVIANNTTDSGGGTYTNFFNPAPGGRGDAPLSEDLIAAFAAEPGDRRFDELTAPATNALGVDAIFTTKYPDVVNDASDGMVLRIAEMFLIRAEANLRGNLSIGATPLEDVNIIRERAMLAPLVSVDLDAILLERRKEFALEGLRRMDLLRNNLNLRPEGGAESAPGADKVIFPIVDDEINNNPNAVQNPGNF